MTGQRHAARAVRSWLEEGVTILPDHVLDRVLEEVAETPQRRFQWSARKLGIAAAAAVIALAVVIGLGVVPVVVRVGDPEPTPLPEPVSFVPLLAGPVDAGRYVVDEQFAVDITFTLPDGWSKFGVGPDHLAIVKSPDGGLFPSPPGGMAIGFFVVDNLFADPCALEERMVDPPVGPAVEDLADALEAIAAYRSSAPQPAVIDGYSGLRMTVDLELYMCPASQADLWRTGSGFVRNAQGAQERNTIWILDVDGVRLVINSLVFPGTSADDRTELDEVVASVRIRPRAEGE